MRTKKISTGLFILAIGLLSTYNVNKCFSTSNEIGFTSLSDIVQLNTALAEDSNAGTNCTGSKCDDANGNKYNYLETGGQHWCCGVTWVSRGKSHNIFIKNQ